jgi:hypothetical protein
MPVATSSTASLSSPITGDRLTPEALRARFKARCLATNNLHQNWQIRVHRSLSWYKRASALDQEQPEAKFLFLWIALNSLYGRWNAETNAPDVDGRSRQELLHRLCRTHPELFGPMLHRCRSLLKRILGPA